MMEIDRAIEKGGRWRGCRAGEGGRAGGGEGGGERMRALASACAEERERHTQGRLQERTPYIAS